MADKHEHGLRVRREGEPSGWWRWRRATYAVYSIAEAGKDVLIVRGRFRSHAEALQAARSSSLASDTKAP